MGEVIQRDVDRGWAWVVLTSSSVILALLGAFVTSIGIFQVEFLESFHGSQGLVALICSIALSSQYLLGVGTGLCYTPAVTVVSTYFQKFRTVVSGISLGAPGVGILGAPYLVGWMIEYYGWRFAMAYFGCVMAQICVLASLFFPHDTSLTSTCCTPSPTRVDNAVRKGGQRSEVGVMVESRSVLGMTEFGSMMLSHWSVALSMEDVKSANIRQRLKHVLCSRLLWVLYLNQLLLVAGFSITIILFPAYAQSVGLTLSEIPPLYIVYGVAVIASRTLGGFVFNRILKHLIKALFCMQMAYACVLLLLPVCGVSFSSLLVFKLFIGLTYGPSFSLLAPILIRHVGLRDLSVAFGVVMLTSGLGSVLAPPIAGALYDAFGDYRICYFVAGSTVGAAALSLFLLLLMKNLQPLNDDQVNKNPPGPAGQREALIPVSQPPPDSSAPKTVLEPASETPKIVIHEIDNEEAMHELFRGSD
ncbi:monocarboxylate transporter 12-B-like isoform X2 [Babylonia areolata]|uniref:monocarboxylate transporter 12-B-like isoform X2 n=1 Tax=Babylonia areolata TaxID=304850 RepID=UPI003FD1AF20